MLNKKICLQCYIKSWKGYPPDTLRVFFLDDWNKGLLRCKRTGTSQLIFLSKNEEPQDCPYMLEHVLEGHSNV
jgi:hypothetical protein